MIRKEITVCYIHTKEVAFNNINSPDAESQDNKNSPYGLYPVSIFRL